MATSLLLSLLLFSVIVAGPSRFFFEFLATAVVVGAVVWVPVALLSVYPGRWVFRRIRGAIRGGRVRNLAGTALAAAAVAVVGAVGAICLAWIPFFSGQSLRDLAQAILILCAVGVPGAMMAGLLVFVREDCGHG
ncbi:MAG: hypothetical protein MUF73_07050 [Rhodobacteraceae bacterium]|nr:hypothetical protein [Paracoccaceae bacterium]